MQSLIVSALDAKPDDVEIVERKGAGHPDAICDALAETLSRNLCREYRRRFGRILHYNVDKALLCGGQAAPVFGGGSLTAPINIYLAGQATTKVGDEDIHIKDIAIEESRSWLRANLHALDADKHVRVHELVRPGSHDLQDLFSRRGQHKAPLANDTSVGVGFAPMSALERLVLAIERQINGRRRNIDHPAWGEDVKVMGIRHGKSVLLTIACAMIGRHLAHIDDYLAEKVAIEEVARALAAEHGFATCDVKVNAADVPGSGAVYLTVTGTSAEAGDDGQVGRGNRINGLITPCRPMSLEAAAGKNPVTHVGKIYSIIAQRIAETLVEKISEITAAHCLMVSQIGASVGDPSIVQTKVAAPDTPPMTLRRRIEEITADHLARIPQLVDDLDSGKVSVF